MNCNIYKPRNFMNFKLKIWRQKSKETNGFFETHNIKQVSEDMSFLEMLDFLNESLIESDQIPFEFDSDCREGICGSCSLVINGEPHGPELRTASCQLHMRSFKDGSNITVEPFRAKAFPVLKDLVVDRTPLDRVVQAGGYISANTGSAPEAATLPVSKVRAEEAFEYAACIGCGACVAVCPNASASLFVAAKVRHFSLLPQGQVEEKKRVKNMVMAMDKEGFGACSNTGLCSKACPKEISLEGIAKMNKLFIKSRF